MVPGEGVRPAFFSSSAVETVVGSSSICAILGNVSLFKKEILVNMGYYRDIMSFLTWLPSQN